MPPHASKRRNVAAIAPSTTTSFDGSDRQKDGHVNSPPVLLLLVPSSTTMDCSTDIRSTSTQRRRRVSFKPTVHIREFPARRSDDYKSRIWYTEPEYDEIEASNTRVVKLILNAMDEAEAASASGDQAARVVHPTLPSPTQQRRIEQQVGDAVRGLEGSVPPLHDLKTERRKQLYQAVMTEQTRIRRTTRRQSQQTSSEGDYERSGCRDGGNPIIEGIARVSQRVTASCRREAATTGLRDERFIRNEFGPLEPTGDLQYTATTAISSSFCRRKRQ
jgi:hypothetical protein